MLQQELYVVETMEQIPFFRKRKKGKIFKGFALMKERGKLNE